LKRNWVIMAVVVGLAVLAMYQDYVKSAGTIVLPTEQAPKAGYLAPHFALQDFDGRTYSVGGERDKALLINFWASWCNPCEREAPDLVRLYEKYKDRLDIYAVNVTTEDTVEDARAFAERFGFPFPVLLDLDDRVTNTYLVMGYPTSFIVDKHGVVREVVLGIREPKELEKLVRRAL